MSYPKPDRSTHRPNRVKTPENEQLDIGWAEGALSDGRPWRLELWAQDQITSATVFLSSSGLETCSAGQLAELLEREGIIRWAPDARRSAYPALITDASGNPMWSINVIIGIDDDPPVADSVPVRPYGPPLT